MLTTLTDRTVGSLQLGAGAFVLGLDVDGATSATELREQIAEALAQDDQTLGMTTGGGWFRCVPALRSPGEEHRRPPTVGETLVDGWVVTLSGTMVELTPEHIAAVLPGSRVNRTGRVAEMTLTGGLDPEDYLPRLCWVGDTSRGLVAIELTGALNVAGAAFHFVERGEGTVPFEFRAHQEHPAGEVPCRVVFLED